MKDTSGYGQIQEALSTAQSALIVLPQKLNHDKVAAALSAYLSLKKAGKQAVILCFKPMTVEYSSLVGVNQITKKLPGRNLVISFDYLEDSIGKVSYNIEGNKFNLVVQPKEGCPPLSTKRVSYSYSGGQSDLIFIIGASSFEDLGGFYFNNKQLFEQSKTVNLNIDGRNSRFGKINLINSRAACYSEVMAELLHRLKLPVDVDIASNLLQGLEKATGSFSSRMVNANTFEAAALCLRAGAKRHPEKPKTAPSLPASGETSKPALQSMPAKISAQESPEEKKQEPSSDWFEPKIYKGNTLA